MNDKLTYRDILVYMLNGLISLVLFGLVYRCQIIYFLSNHKIENSEFILFMLIPFGYLIGHVILSIDNLIFNKILGSFGEFLSKKTKKTDIKTNTKTRIFRVIHFLIFEYRIRGIKSVSWDEIKDGDFGLFIARLRNENRYEHADRYCILSDSFKGLVIIELLIIGLTIFKSDWIYFSISLFLLILFYLRARKYSSEYIWEIKN